MDMLANYLSPVLLIVGAFFCISGGIGILRFPDVFTRMHATGVTDTLGAALILVALMLMSTTPIEVIKLVLILLFSWLTAPTASHALAKAVLHAGVDTNLGQNSSEPARK